MDQIPKNMREDLRRMQGFQQRVRDYNYFRRFYAEDNEDERARILYMLTVEDDACSVLELIFHEHRGYWIRTLHNGSVASEIVEVTLASVRKFKQTILDDFDDHDSVLFKHYEHPLLLIQNF